MRRTASSNNKTAATPTTTIQQGLLPELLLLLLLLVISVFALTTITWTKKSRPAVDPAEQTSTAAVAGGRHEEVNYYDDDDVISNVSIKVVVQNLQKRSHLATDLLDEYNPDILLAQEISLYSEDKERFPTIATNEDEEQDEQEDHHCHDDEDDDGSDDDSPDSSSDSSSKQKHVAYNVYKWFGYGTAIWCKNNKTTKTKMNEQEQQEETEMVTRRRNNASNSFTLHDIRQVDSPYGEVFAASFIYKKTTIATLHVDIRPSSSPSSSASQLQQLEGGDDTDESGENGKEDKDENSEDDSQIIMIELVSFHGYNGQPFKNLHKLLAHVQAVLDVLSSDPKSPAIFAGDFNTWSQHHIDAVVELLSSQGFRHVVFDNEPWIYPGRELPLDHLFIRDGNTAAGATAAGSSINNDNSNNMLLSLEVQNFRTYANKSDHHGAVFDLIVKKKKKNKQTATKPLISSEELRPK